MDIKILDCTLRDGGYVNNWEFKENTIESIVSKLIDTNIDIIECGFLTEKCINSDFSLFCDNEKINNLLKKHINSNKQFVFMLDAAENEEFIEQILNSTSKIDYGIRLCFNKSEIQKALTIAKKIKKSGHTLFLQPKKIFRYTSENLNSLLILTNEIEPFAFYIVDSFGNIKKNELLDLFEIIDKSLKKNIKIGFHPHNNLQLSFSNAKALVNLDTKRELIIDSSVYGMGRGAGNLPTELFAKHLNEKFGKDYYVEPIFDIYTKYLADIFKITPWGYSLPYVLSAINNCHPNYATFLSTHDISLELINQLLSELPDDKKEIYDEIFLENQLATKKQRTSVPC